MNFKKVLTGVVAVAVVVGTLGGCSLGNQEQAVKTSDKSKIIFASNRTDYVNNLYVEYEKEFEDKNPDIDLVIDVQKDYEQSLKIKLASNDAPDVWTMFPNTMTQQQIMDANIPLNDLDIYKNFDYTDTFEGVDGKAYGLVQGITLGGVLGYNKKILAEAGAEVPQTTDELIDAAKKVKATGKVGLASSAKAKWTLMDYEVYSPMYFSKNADVLNSIAAEKDPFTIDSAFGKSFMLLKRFNDEGILENDPLSADWEPFKKDFRDGKIAMFFLDGSVAPQVVSETVKAEDIGIAPFPFDNDKANRFIVYKPETGLGISKISKNPEAAKAFFNFMMDEKYLDYLERNSLISARKDMEADIPYFKSLENFTYEKMDCPPKTEQTANIVSNGQVDFSAKLQEVLTGKDVSEILGDLNKQWTKGQSK